MNDMRKLITYSLLFLVLLITNLPASTVSRADSGQADILIPLSGSTNIYPAAVVVELDEDDAQEILVVNEEGRLFLVDGKTNSVEWSVSLADYLPDHDRVWVSANLAAGDLTYNDSIEIVIATGGPLLEDGKPGSIIVLTYTGGNPPLTLAPGWPQFPQDEVGNSDNPGRPDGNSRYFFIVASHW